MRFYSKGILMSLMVAAMGASAAPLKTTVKASSAYPPEDGTTYDAKNVADNKAVSSWVEGDKGGGMGAWLEFDLGGTKTVGKIKVWPGMFYSAEYWGRMNRPKELDVKFSDGSVQSFPLKDEMKPQELVLKSPKKTSTVRLTIKNVYNGSTWQDTAISEVQIFDTSPSKFAVPTSVKASTVADSDDDGSYVGLNVADGLPDTMWCNKGGDGAGQSLTFTFSGKQTVSKLDLFNGIGTSMLVWFKGNRATKATLTFDDGSTTSIALPNKFKTQTVSFPSKSTSSVKLTIDAIAKGKSLTYLCISEANFSN